MSNYEPFYDYHAKNVDENEANNLANQNENVIPFQPRIESRKMCRQSDKDTVISRMMKFLPRNHPNHKVLLLWVQSASGFLKYSNQKLILLVLR